MPEYTDGRLLSLYRDWSEDTWATVFMDPGEGIVGDFRLWLHSFVPSLYDPGPGEDYEHAMLAEYRKQEAET